MQGNIKRVEILLEQSRYAEAKDLLETHLSNYPEDALAQLYLASVYLQLGDKKKSRSMTELLLEKMPDNYAVLNLAVEVELADDLNQAAEGMANLLIEEYPQEAGSYIKMARVKMAFRNYDRALENVNRALELDAEDIDALNLKIMIGGFLGDGDTQRSIEDALHLDPESASTIANQGMQLLREGKGKQALERLQYALSLEPTNPMARYAMMEALKARFLPYRLFFKYKEFGAKLSGNGSWTLIIGAYVVYSVLRRIARSNPSLEPFLMPVVYGIAGLFLLTWVMDPLMNLYLLTNKYGRLLLDEDDKKMAKLTGASLAIGLFCFALSFPLPDGPFFLLGIMGLLMMIPLGTFLNATREKNRRLLTLYTAGLVVLGIAGAVLNINMLILMTFFGIFAYQWIINGIIIKENARVFGD